MTEKTVKQPFQKRQSLYWIAESSSGNGLINAGQQPSHSHQIAEKIEADSSTCAYPTPIAIDRNKPSLNQLILRTLVTAQMWAYYAPDGGGMFPRLTHPNSVCFVAAGPGTIYELNAAGLKLFVHKSQDGLVWVRHKAHGDFRARQAIFWPIQTLGKRKQNEQEKQKGCER